MNFLQHSTHTYKMNKDKIISDIRELIDDMKFSEKDARINYRHGNACLILYYLDKLQLILDSNMDTFELDE